MPPAGLSGPPEPAFDAAELIARAMDDAEFALELVETFLGQSAGLLAELTSAIESADAEAASRVAHAFKGSAATVSAHAVSAVAADVESAARRGEIDTAQQLVEALVNALEGCRRDVPALEVRLESIGAFRA